jgi:hypothetical protein
MVVAIPERHPFHPTIAVHDAQLATLHGSDALRHFDAREPFVDSRMGSRLADEEEVSAGRQHVLTDRLAGIEIVAEIDRIELRITRAMRCEPSPRGAAFAILLLAPVLGRHEFRWRGHDAKSEIFRAVKGDQHVTAEPLKALRPRPSCNASNAS